MKWTPIAPVTGTVTGISHTNTTQRVQRVKGLYAIYLAGSGGAAVLTTTIGSQSSIALETLTVNSSNPFQYFSSMVDYILQVDQGIILSGSFLIACQLSLEVPFG